MTELLPPLDLVPERIRVKVIVADGCWEWNGNHNSWGYSQTWWEGRHRPVHRLFMELLGRAVPGEVIDHLCRNKGCVNPAHLESVTYRENTRRGNSWQGETCRRGHPYEGDNLIITKKQRICRACRNMASNEWYRKRGYRRLTPTQAKLLEEIRAAGVLYVGRYGRYWRTVDALLRRGLVEVCEPDHSRLRMDGYRTVEARGA